MSDLSSDLSPDLPSVARAVPLAIQLLGGFAVTLDGQPVRAFRTAKTRALLAYLVVEANRAHSRNTLATLFWGELPDSAAKTNLRIELSNLKSLLAAHPALELGRNEVCFRSNLATVDLHTLQTTIAAFHTLPNEARTRELGNLAASIQLYQGEFLAGLQLSDAEEFEDWQLLTREQLHEQVMLALKTLQAGYAEQGRWLELADSARRQLALVPWTESAHRYLMQALAAQGQTQAALAQFERCRAILQEELGIEPALATLELAARLRGDGAATPTVRHNLTQPLKAFVGRKAEIDKLCTWVNGEKLVTVLGIGGVGKSHLAQAVAQSVLRDFADGVWFVPLANVEAGHDAADRIALAIAAAVDFQVTDLHAPLVELAAHLADKRMLLLLDNWEHLVEAAPTVCEALLLAPGVHILATSRVRLMAEGERVVQLEGLPRPEAYALFVERARRAEPGFVANGDGAAQSGIYAICDQVAGLPLGIELAASWVEHYSVAEIGQQIAKIAVQPQQADALLMRHHSLGSVFEFSWQLLTPRQQQILTHLSVFRGGFDRAAATIVAESALHDLSSLIAHSLVQRVTAGRYDLHPLIQEFAASKLGAEQATSLYAKYADHYLLTLKATSPSAWRAQLFDDLQNIRHAWQQAARARATATLQPTVSAFAEFILQFGLMTDGNQLMADAATHFEEDDEHREMLASILDQQASFVRRLHGLQAVVPLQKRVLTLTTDFRTLFFGHFDLANYYGEMGDWEQANFHFDRSLEAAEASGDLGLYIEAIEGRTNIEAIHFRSDFAQGISQLQALLALLDAPHPPLENEVRTRLNVIQSMAFVATRYGDYALSIRTDQQALALATEVGMRPRQAHILLNLALAEQFAGLYIDALAHIQAAMTICEEIGDVDEIGLLKANLCLTLRQSGAPEEALAYGLEAIEIMQRMGIKRIEGQARNRVSHVLAVLERWEEAYTAYGDALTVWNTMQHPNRYEAVAGRAAAAAHLGKHDEALALVDEVLTFVANGEVVKTVDPARLFLNCEKVLTALGHEARARDTLIQAQNWMHMSADRISDEQIRASFLQRPDNQALRARMAARLDT